MNILTSLVRRSLAVAVLGLGGLLLATPASAQTIGTFPFALQPFCNQLSITITQEGSTYRLAGWDDACGANERYPLRGVITPNSDGTLHFAFTVTRPNGIAVETSARNFNLGNFQASWTDSAGNTGTFVLQGASGGSGARPGPSSTLASNSVSTVNIVDGSITAADINPAQVQLRVGGTCPSGQAVASVNQNGTVNCVAAGGTTPTLPFTVAVENSPIGGPLDTTCRQMIALPLTIPAAGSISCTAVQHAILNHVSGPDPSYVTSEIELSSADCPADVLAGTYSIPAQLTNFTQTVSVPVQRSFSVTTGTTTVYLNARLWNAATGNQKGNVLSCTFTPQ